MYKLFCRHHLAIYVLLLQYMTTSNAKISLLLLLFWGATTWANAQAYRPGELILKLQHGANINRVAEDLAIEPERLLCAEMDLWLMRFDTTVIDDNQVLSNARRHKSTLVVQFNHFLTQRDTVPSDSLFASQWHWKNTGQDGGTVGADVNAATAWATTIGGTTPAGDTIVVAVIDDGLQTDHPDLAANIWHNHAEVPNDGLDNDDNGYIDDFMGWNIQTQTDDILGGNHGVGVCGMLGAVGNNGIGVSGLNWHTRIMMIDTDLSTDEADIIEAYTYVWRQRKLYNQTGGAKGTFVVAVNSSWGTAFDPTQDLPVWCAMYDSLGKDGILAIGATSNSSINVDTEGDLPSSCGSSYLIMAARTDKFDHHAGGYGAVNVDVGAPGINVLTTTPNNGYGLKTGTSFAAPIVTGLVGLIYSSPCLSLSGMAHSNPTAAAEWVRDAIFLGVDVKPELVGKVATNGRVNAANSLQIIQNGCPTCPTVAMLQVAATTETSATLTWNSLNAPQSLLRWRLLGSTTWNETGVQTSPFMLTGLTLCNQYEVEVSNQCNQEITAATNLIFGTKGCCVAPENVIFDNITEHEATIHWQCDDAGNNIVIEMVTVAPFSSTNLATLSYSTQSWTLTGLETCKNYYIRVGTTCSNGTVMYSSLFQLTTSGCGDCTDIPYCSPAPPNNTFEWIDAITVGDQTYTTGQNTVGYTAIDNPNPPIILPRNYPFWFQVVPKFLDTPYPELIWAMIDYNSDGIFSEADNETLFDGGQTNVTAESFVMIPNEIDTGLVRMRVLLKYVNQSANYACNGFESGEIEDYCVRITNQLPCPAPMDLTVTDTSDTGLLFRWQAQSTPTIYTLRYRMVGSTDWQTATTTSDSIWINDLAICSIFEVGIRANCMPMPSYYTPSLPFSSYCPNSQTNNPDAPKALCQMGPNPFSTQIWLKPANGTGITTAVQIHHADGRRILDKPIQLLGGQSTYLDLPADLPDGVYTVSVYWQDGLRWHSKLVKSDTY